MTTLRGKVAVITGGNSGIGYATATELVARGAQVIITGRRQAAVDQAATALPATGLVADQSRLPDVERLVAEVAERVGKVDLLLINAGISKFALIEATDEALFDEVMNVNFKGAYFTLSKFIPVLNDNASVVFLSSSSASISKTPFPRQFASVGFMMVCIFIAMLPFGFFAEFDKLGANGIWVAVPFVILISWVYVVMELVGDYSENSFEGLANDVPMLALSRTIEIDLLQQLGEAALPAPIQPVKHVLL